MSLDLSSLLLSWAKTKVNSLHVALSVSHMVVFPDWASVSSNRGLRLTMLNDVALVLQPIVAMDSRSSNLPGYKHLPQYSQDASAQLMR